MTNSPHRRPRTPVFVRALLLVCAIGGVLAAVPVTQGGAATIDDQRAEATRLEAEINDNATQLATLHEQIMATQYQLDQAKAAIADSKAGIVTAQANVDRITGLVRERAATVYKHGGDSGIAAFQINIAKQAAREKYANATTQKDSQLLDQLATAKEDLAAREQSAEKVRADVQRQQDALQSQQAQFQSANAARQKLLDGVNGDIARLVAEAEAARRAAEAPKVTAGVSGGNPPQFDTSKIPPPSGSAGAVVAYAMAQLGKPYCYAGTGPDCYDCSGLTMMAWGQVGVYMPHNSEAQFGMFARVPMNQVQPGDIVWFPGHVGIYAGGGAVINATHTGDFVRIHDISLYQGAVRPA